MRRIHYVDSYVLTGDRTCKALLRYARALALANLSDIVQIPVITESGSRAYAHLLIGPASQIFSTPVPDSPDEPLDTDVIEKLEAATRKLQPARPEWPDEMTNVPDFSFDI
ncbi:hypothetical protein [Curtobacterium sp. ISL-83]|uniref:hypothetical protein n=1 Tax=Curtobacterium sp. ISL-83 TaxID=2819145 RepID=UPI001BE7190A|nr:hypothetical protein [Curtobacterium sp. ISL-83]MBT2501678.1 hypothetical protein [Curtobacterium sp. ISL-83]